MHPFLNLNLLKRTLSAWLAIVLAITQTGFSPAIAQSAPDFESPIIEIEAVFEAEAGKTQIFTALVADDQQLKDVTLYHRRAGRQAFERAPMLPLGTIGYYSVDLPTDPSDLRAIEYYVQARDEGGNRSISGFAFDPYQRTLTATETVVEPLAETITSEKPAAAATASTADATSEASNKSSNRKWWIAAAVLIGVVLASSSSGGGSGDNPDRTELTINLPLPEPQ